MKENMKKILIISLVVVIIIAVLSFIFFKFKEFFVPEVGMLIAAIFLMFFLMSFDENKNKPKKKK